MSIAHFQMNYKIFKQILKGYTRDAFRELKAKDQLHHGSGTFDYGDWSVWL